PPEPPPEIEATTSVSPTEEEVAQVKQFDLTQVWQQVLTNLQPISRRELLRQMCHLVEFDGTVARVAIKEAWYERVKLDQPRIVEAFKETFKCDVNIRVEKATSTTSIPPLTSPQNKPTTRPSDKPPTAPSVELPKSTQSPTTKFSDTAKNAALKTTDTTHRGDTPSPTQPQASTPDWEVDEVTAAAQRLAHIFDGEIIRLTDDIQRPTSTSSGEWEGEVEVDDEF
nr:DNA polymerase III subunit gamma/tau [Brasilonema sp. UFV-L1]